MSNYVNNLEGRSNETLLLRNNTNNFSCQKIIGISSAIFFLIAASFTGIILFKYPKTVVNILGKFGAKITSNNFFKMLTVSIVLVPAGVSLFVVMIPKKKSISKTEEKIEEESKTEEKKDNEEKIEEESKTEEKKEATTTSEEEMIEENKKWREQILSYQNNNCNFSDKPEKEIFPGIFLGGAVYFWNFIDGKYKERRDNDSELLDNCITEKSKDDIKYVLGVDNDLCTEKYVRNYPNIKHKTIIKTKSSCPLEENINDIVNFIDEARKNKKDILIYCVMGEIYNDLILICYLMKKCEVSFDEALNFIKLKRSYDESNTKLINIYRKEWLNS